MKNVIRAQGRELVDLGILSHTPMPKSRCLGKAGITRLGRGSGLAHAPSPCAGCSESLPPAQALGLSVKASLKKQQTVEESTCNRARNSST